MSELHRMSLSQFGGLLDFDPAQIADVQLNHEESSITIVLADEGDTMSQTTGAFPQLAKGGKKIGGKRSGRRSC